MMAIIGLDEAILQKSAKRDEYPLIAKATSPGQLVISGAKERHRPKPGKWQSLKARRAPPSAAGPAAVLSLPDAAGSGRP